ncbi:MULTISPECIES: AAA family ATPase [unclassified Leptolyngbya]|uniref:AAA family ATPase n=1 Tax=unclassified Leptolyngbya TaxID=2650499 RepID=UPI0016891CE2|nr:MULTISPECIES: AAA family ATPase [unclassified Leptolyngbya]MBD1910329.1 AAA family ATPase [Leptolyngbya sp. FACHB-8]MBD2154868.1 AAA family ATPase [Leptolyngbya sp. FACHB-16]
MSPGPVSVSFFTDNWAYLKTELSWLDRVLMVSVSRQRKENQGVDRIAQTAADRVSSHWWRGMISLDGGKGAYDEHRPPSQNPAQNGSGRYQQQLEVRIRASQQQGVVLALPLLCDRLGLDVFEKNLVLMALAPEVNRRYGQLYRFLQGAPDANTSDLPTVDLVLRLLSRNDAEWRAARSCLRPQAPLVKRGLLRFLPETAETLLSQRLQLAPRLVDFLLAEVPLNTDLDAVLGKSDESSESISPPPCWVSSIPSTVWDDLVLPASLLQDLQGLCKKLEIPLAFPSPLEPRFAVPDATLGRGAIALLTGPPGTGKRTAAGAIAHSLNLPLAELDLATLAPEQYADVLQALAQENLPVLLIRGAELWLRRSSPLSSEALQGWLTQRRQRSGITLLSVTYAEAVALRWQRQIDTVCQFSKPPMGDRQVLWQRAFPKTVPLAEGLDWSVLAQQFALTGGEIRAIAQTAIHHLAIRGGAQLTYEHLAVALLERGLTLVVPKPKRSRPKRS